MEGKGEGEKGQAAIPPASVTGAGDAFTAAALLALATDATPEQALGAAITAASALLETSL